MALMRSMFGPTRFDRILALNMFGTKTVLVIAVYGFLTNRPEFLDLALVYALMGLFSFAAVGWNGVFMAEIARIAPEETTSKATGAVLVVSFAGILIGPPAFTATHALLGTYTVV